MKKQSTLKLNTLMREAFLAAEVAPGKVTERVIHSLQKGVGVIHRKKMWSVNSRRRKRK